MNRLKGVRTREETQRDEGRFRDRHADKQR